MHGRILAAGAALTLALVAGCGGSSSKSSSSGAAAGGVTLSISGSSGNVNSIACGKQEAFYLYKPPAQVAYSGTVSPAPQGRWKVKIKLKRCSGSSFVDEDSQKIVGQPTGRFDGVFRITRSGAYSLRARLEQSGRPESEKVYLKVG